MISDAAQHRWALDEGTFRLWLPITILFAIWWNLKLSLHASQMMKARRAFFTRIPSEFVEIATPSGLQMDRLSATTKSARHAMLMLLPPVILVTAVGASPATSIMIWISFLVLILWQAGGLLIGRPSLDLGFMTAALPFVVAIMIVALLQASQEHH